MTNENQYLIDKPRFLAPTTVDRPIGKGIDAFWDDRTNTLTLLIGEATFTLYPAQAWDLLNRLEVELYGADRDRKDD